MANNISGINPSGTPSAIDVQNAGESAISFNEQLPNLEAKLRDALTSKFNESPLFGQRQTAEAGFLNQPTQTRADISQMQQTSGVPLSPTQQQSIESARRSAAYVPLASNTLQMGSAYGGLEDMLGSGVKAFEAAGKGMTDRANLLKDLRTQELDRMFKEQGIALDWAKLQATTTKEQQTAGKDMLATQTKISNLKNQIQSVRDLIATGKTSTGFTQNLKFGLQKSGINPLGMLGKPTGEQSRLSTAIADINTQLFELAGKAVTEGEKKLIEGLIINMNSTPDYINQQLNQMDIITNRKLNDLGWEIVE